MHVPKRNPRQEYRLKQRELIEASPLMRVKFPRLKSLQMLLAYYDASGTTKSGEMKCKVNVWHARATLWFACPVGDCVGGDFDFSQPVANAVAGGLRVVTGELRCLGTRRRTAQEQLPCQTLLRYKLNLLYD